MKTTNLKGNWNEIKGKFKYAYDDLAETEMIFAQDQFLEKKKIKIVKLKKKLEK